MNCGILNCDASRVLCGEVWFKCYDSFYDKNKKKVICQQSKNVFKFRNGRCVSSFQFACIPTIIGTIKAVACRGEGPGQLHSQLSILLLF